MSDEMKPEVLPGDLISGPGVYISRSNCAVEVRGYDHGYWRAEWEDGARWYHSSGTQTGLPARDDPYQLVRWVGPLAEDIPTTSEQIAEIEGQMAEPEPEPENCGFEGKILREIPQPVQIREGRWRTRNGEIRHVTPTPKARLNADRFPWHDAHYNQTWLPSGHYHFGGDSQFDLLEYLEPSEPEPCITPDDVAAETINEWPSVKLLRQEMEATELALLEQQQRNEQLVTQGSQQHMEIAELQAQVRFLKNRELTLGTRLEEEKAVTTKRLQQVEELRSEVSHVQGLLGTERRRVTQLEELVTSLRTINEAQEKAFNAAGKANTDLQHRLNVVAAEWAEQAEAIRRLQIELDAAQQVPADSPELRQLRADLEQVTRERDQYKDAYDRIFADLQTIRETTTAEIVEAIAEWLQPIRAVDNEHLANETLQHLPQIMRSLTGLADED